MSLVDLIMTIFLAASNTIVLGPLFLVGFFFIDTILFGRAMCGLMFSMVYSQLLKCIFIILIPTSIGDGHVFPSGHTLASVIFYGWLLINIQYKPIIILIIVTLLGIGSSLVYFNFHNWYDVCGGVIFGAIYIIFMLSVLKKVDIFQTSPYFIGYFLFSVAIVLFILTYFISYITNAQIFGMCMLILLPSLWMCYDALLTLAIVHKTVPCASMV